MTSDDLPIGRRVARWRVRRQMTQQMLADRLRRSKSWVDKIERGARTLDRYSVIQELAHVLRVDPEVLLGQPQGTPASTPDGVDDIRAALARYDTSQAPPRTDELRRQVGHAWLTYQHAHYGQLLRVLPGLLDAAQGGGSAELLVQAYRITSSLLVKLGEADLAWLAADRAMSAAGDGPLLAATATISVGQALRAQDRDRLALAVLLPAANRVLPQSSHCGGQESGDRTARKILDHQGQGEHRGRAVGGTLLATRERRSVQRTCQTPSTRHVRTLRGLLGGRASQRADRGMSGCCGSFDRAAGLVSVLRSSLCGSLRGPTTEAGQQQGSVRLRAFSGWRGSRAPSC
ncbi:helix-turn-helix domain-containing protein [Micromonospora profundi]|uniref:helix-turn-helix domain-containing protein n=1 Tax=Micromonospora TaxID=1873 RepID=UPI0033A9BD13